MAKVINNCIFLYFCECSATRWTREIDLFDEGIIMNNIIDIQEGPKNVFH